MRKKRGGCAPGETKKETQTDPNPESEPKGNGNGNDDDNCGELHNHDNCKNH